MARRAGPRTLADTTVAVVARGTGPAWACRLSAVIPLLAAIFLLHGVQVVCLLLLTAGVVLLAVALRRLGRSDPDRDPLRPRAPDRR